MRKWSGIFLVLLAVFLSSCAEKTGKPEIELKQVAFSDLPGWSSDHISEALPALLRSCDKQPAIGGYADLCAKAAQLPSNDDAAAWTFFEQGWNVFAVSDGGNEEGLFTGYYEPQLRGSLQQEGAYQTPLYARPDDLITVELGDFKPDLKGQRITGKVTDRKLKPYDERAEIVKNGLKDRAAILAYVDDPADAFFLAVQGSGSIVLTDGSLIRVGYDGANGRAYIAIGKAMADQGLIEKPVTMQKIRDWLKAHPDQANDILNLNPSYVFFRKIEGDGPIGAQGVALTAQRSLAVDPRYMTLGSPLWLDTVDSGGAPLRKLVVAQDTGGAIKGVVRGDFFWGSGSEAGAQAGAMQSKGRYYLLLPKDKIHAE